MLKKRHQLEDFRKAFSFLKGQIVVFYGTGQYTELLLREPLEFQVVGLMDRKKTGSVCYGLPVLSEEQVYCSGCKTIILVANLSTALSIFQRIEDFTQKCGITVYYMNGRRAGERPMEVRIPSTWTLSKGELIKKAQHYDVISFDLFDTLISRKCVFPAEVFSIVEQRANENGVGLENFTVRRQEAEKKLYHTGNMWYRLDDIYNYLEAVYHMEPGSLNWIKELELTVEWEMASPRKDIICCYDKLQSIGKRVIITSDMYLTHAQLDRLLQKCEIKNAELYVSNEHKASKYIGSLFKKIKDFFPGQRILHIGDNPRTDVVSAQKNGIDALLLPSPSAWIEVCGLTDLKDCCTQLYELFNQRCFSSGFPWDSIQKKIRISGPSDVGYLFFSPLAVGYLMWLVGQLQKQEIDHILFISRDGYLFYQLYQKIQKLYNNLPKASYFLTSRRCASVAALKTEEDARFAFENIYSNKEMCLIDILEKGYGLSLSVNYPEANRTLGELGNDCAWAIIQKYYMKDILSHAAVERKHYLQYIDALKISGEKIGMMNFVGRGVTQRCLQAIFGKKFVGFYVALEYDSDSILGNGELAFSWYPELLSTHTGTRKLAEQLLLGEAVFSAPHGTVISFEDGGRPIYETTSKNQTNFIFTCHQGIQEYLDDILLLNGDIQNTQNLVDVVDKLFGYLCDNQFLLPDNIKKFIHF